MSDLSKYSLLKYHYEAALLVGDLYMGKSFTFFQARDSTEGKYGMSLHTKFLKREMLIVSGVIKRKSPSGHNKQTKTYSFGKVFQKWYIREKSGVPCRISSVSLPEEILPLNPVSPATDEELVSIVA
jgi:hypothetical protein